MIMGLKLLPIDMTIWDTLKAFGDTTMNLAKQLLAFLMKTWVHRNRRYLKVI